ncbi:MAG TPA: circadian clock protein KaiC, partial [Planctomycetota bacterium]|nr:circadian clock protein KaiC [Planctomycetota bacterium]
MTPRLPRRPAAKFHLEKAATGIEGLDEITQGGLPRARPTLLCGTAGCGKTLMAMEFLVRGASQFKEPGVFMAFEETEPELITNVASLGFDIDSLVARKKLFLDHVRVERSEIEETGEYDLEGLFIRLGHAIDSVGAKRVVLDTIESLFAGFSNPSFLRAELRRLFRWLKDRKVTAIITAERGEGQLTRQGLEEYVSDCVILLDHRVIDQITTRRMRIVKYRGSSHGTNEYPFLIEQDGISVLPITSVGLDHQASTERISSGVPALDQMLGGKGYYRGSTVLVSGTAGTGKSSLATHFAADACRRGERCVYFAFEESPGQIVRNMRTIGLDLAPWLDGGLLKIISSRPTLQGLEMHLLRMHQEIQQHRPRVVVVDPVTNLINAGNLIDTKSMLMRMIDFLKTRGITALMTSLTPGGAAVEATEIGISSLIDTWIILRDLEVGGERNRAIQVLKARGVSHSNKIREFLVTER